MILTGEYLEAATDETLDPNLSEVDAISVDVHASEDLPLEPNSFGTLPAYETFSVPTNLACLLTGRSSHMRRGIYMPGGWIDPGMSGEVELEFFNMSDRHFEVAEGEPAARLVFFELAEHVDPYDGRWSE